MTGAETAAAMRANGQGIVNDADKPKTKSDGSGKGGGGGKLHVVPSPGPDEYPSLSSGTTPPPFTPSTRPHVSTGSLNHVLQRHQDTPERRAAWPNKTKFPPSWSVEEIRASLDEVLRKPEAVWHFGDTYRFRGTVNGKTIIVNVRTDKPRPFIWSAYPVD
ncbi:MAG: EndoU domain-containing protein [Propionibacteriaceae bacterium]|jgi:hypothetical protein|nr:EndoU domain-containing protein [Propionibacteriaceae bacterium]